MQSAPGTRWITVRILRGLGGAVPSPGCRPRRWLYSPIVAAWAHAAVHAPDPRQRYPCHCTSWIRWALVGTPCGIGSVVRSPCRPRWVGGRVARRDCTHASRSGAHRHGLAWSRFFNFTADFKPPYLSNGLEFRFTMLNIFLDLALLYLWVPTFTS